MYIGIYKVPGRWGVGWAVGGGTAADIIKPEINGDLNEITQLQTSVSSPPPGQGPSELNLKDDMWSSGPIRRHAVWVPQN